MHRPPRPTARAALTGLACAAALLGMPALADPAAGADAAGASASGRLYVHAGLPDWAEVGYRSASPAVLRGVVERDRDATGPIFALIEPDGRRLKIAYANNGDPALESTLRRLRGSVCVVRGTVLDWGRGIRSFDISKPLTIER